MRLSPRQFTVLISICTAALLGGAVAARAQSVPVETDRAVMAEIESHGEIMTNLTYLSDQIGGRLTGSSALARATDWAEATMKRYGLRNVHREPYAIPEGWERGAVTARVVSPQDNLHLTMAAVAWSAGTKGTVHGTVVVWNPRSEAEVDSYKGKLKNAIVLLSPPQPPANVLPDRPDESSVDAVFNDHPAPRARMGAGNPGEAPLPPKVRMAIFRKSFALFKSERIAATLFDAGRPFGLLTMFGGWQGMGPLNDTGWPTLITANGDYALLARLADAAGKPGGAPVEVELNDSSRRVAGPITVYNVVGDLPGSDKPNEFVVLGGHLDSWDLAQGTTDNGTGSCVALESARALIAARVKPSRTMRFILFTGEEEGDIGSEAYVKAHVADMPKTSMCLVDDAGTGRAIGLHTQAWTAIGPIFTQEAAPSLAALGFTRIVPGSPIPGGGGGSDHDSFEEAGTPGFILDQLDANYHLIFHSQQDTLDKADPAALTQTASVLALLGLHVADLPDLLPRTK
jgi:carboxypeptidase Q